MTINREVVEARFRERLRLWGVLAVFLAGLCYLGAELHEVQVVRTGEHASALDQNSIRRVRLPATRGKILARDGEVLAECVPSYGIGIYVEELRKPGDMSNTVNAVDALVDRVSARIGRKREIDRDAIKAHIYRRRPLALTAWSGLSEREMARYMESPETFPGTDLQVRADRVYPYGDTAAHVIGYVGRGQPEIPADEEGEPTEVFDFYLPDLLGRGGIEQAYDGVLSGEPGGELLRIDAVGYKHTGEVGRMPRDGENVVLSLRLPWQQTAERLLTGLRGAVVVMDVRTGELLVLATSPRYNLKEFLPKLSPRVWRRLMNDPDRPLVNRATQAIYPPGSTLKPLVALTAPDAGVATGSRIIDCSGAFPISSHRSIRCGHRAGHGPIDMGYAIAQSCNVYFCRLGVDLGYEPRLHDAMAAAGLGRRPVLPIPAGAGLLPTDAWKRRTQRDGWRYGDTANISIGQGFLCVTPLQMAILVSAVANGGKILRPWLVLSPGDRTAPVVENAIPWKAQSLKVVREGMNRVINGDGGGRLARVPGLDVRGKTGTAEYDKNGERKKYTWMIAYGSPAGAAPEYAMSIVVEDGESGGKTVAPLIRAMYAAMYGKTLDETSDEEDVQEYHEAVPEEIPENAEEGPAAPDDAGAPAPSAPADPVPSAPADSVLPAEGGAR